MLRPDPQTFADERQRAVRLGPLRGQLHRQLGELLRLLGIAAERRDGDGRSFEELGGRAALGCLHECIAGGEQVAVLLGLATTLRRGRRTLPLDGPEGPSGHVAVLPDLRLERLRHPELVERTGEVARLVLLHTCVERDLRAVGDPAPLGPFRDGTMLEQKVVLPPALRVGEHVVGLAEPLEDRAEELRCPA